MNQEILDNASPAALRNAPFIADALEDYISEQETILEIASGTGYHIFFLAARYPKIYWQPSEQDENSFNIVEDLYRRFKQPNLHPPLHIHSEEENWINKNIDAILCCNMIHISPISSTFGLFEGAKRYLSADQYLFLYGPFKIGGEHTSESNKLFDESLKARDTRWGVRDINELEKIGKSNQVSLIKKIPLPANNLILIFAKLP